MSIETLETTELSPNLGAEIRGVDFSRPISSQTESALNRALRDFGVLLIRGQRMNPVAFRDNCRIFGTPTMQNYSRTVLEDAPEVAVLSSARSESNAEGKRLLFGTESWHVDHVNLEQPPKATVLYAVRLPGTGGDTSFANAAAAYEDLPETEREMLDGLRTVNGRDRHLPRHAGDEGNFAALVEHPLIRTHPLTGRKAIYCHPMKVDHIIGPDGAWSREKSWAFLDALMDNAIKPRFVYRHQWQVGDFLVCDNRSCLHLAHADYDPDDDRVMYRAILAGERPV